MKAQDSTVISHPERISLAGQNLINIVTALLVAFLLCLGIVVYVILEPANMQICIFIASFIQLIATIVILVELRAAGRNLRSSYAFSINDTEVVMSDVMHQEAYIQEIQHYHTTNNTAFVEVGNECPACQHPIEVSQTVCSSCGLNIG